MSEFKPGDVEKERKMSNEISRRGLLKTAAWTAPAVVVATSAPAFASSHVEPSPECEVKAWRTNHGHGDKDEPGRHDYHLLAGCGDEEVVEVTIAGITASRDADGVWVAHNIRGGVHQPVIVTTREGVRLNAVVRFQPEGVQP